MLPLQLEIPRVGVGSVHGGPGSLSLGAWTVKILSAQDPMRMSPPAAERVQQDNPALRSVAQPSHRPTADQAVETDPALRPETLLPATGSTLIVLRSYPDGVVALWDEISCRVLFLRLQEAFALSWRPSLESSGGETF